ncbi:DAK2 domain-containing protein [Streptomyces sp. SBT349]|uniref:DAK2 domain-containing protein n=1 Tax=Streptomyces sp. SBT349 TaxID=1580539 RepID=UPI00066B7AA3|nr:DAK2 domain-containing protein [Streptomyces sp. SBT349]
MSGQAAGSAAWSADRLAHALALVARRVADGAGELSRLDALAGDGDLGTSLTTGFAAVGARVAELTGPDPAAVLTAAGRALAQEAPSTMGTLLGTVFLRGAAVLHGRAVLDARGLADLLAAGREAVERRGGARVGQRTVLDALSPAASAARAAADAGRGIAGALADSAAAAREGAAATAAMEPQVGRAGWIPDRARGHVDAGASAWALVMTALSDAARPAPASGRAEGSDDG